MAAKPTDIHPPRANGLVHRGGESMMLTEVERLLLEGIQARGREIRDHWVVPYNADVQEINALIEREHGLPSGAMGTTHQVNPETMQLECVFVAPLAETE